MKLHTATTIIREDVLEDGTVIGEHEIEIEATYYAGSNATYHHPGDKPEVEILSASIDGEEIELTEAEEEEVRIKILEDPPEPDHDEE